MSISYLLTLPELAVVAHFCGVGRLGGLPPLPRVDGEEGKAVLASLAEKGMLLPSEEGVAVNPPLRFVVESMGSAALIALSGWGTVCSVTEHLGVVVTRDRHRPGRYLLTPYPSGKELLQAFLEGDGLEDGESAFLVSRGGREEHTDREGVIRMVGEVYPGKDT